METIGGPILWGAFAGIVLVALAVDLFVFHREEHEVSFREGLLWTGIWIGLSLAFNLWIYLEHGSGPGLEFLTGYLIEKALSVDNLFVFIVIFNYFSVPPKYQHRVLFWGIIGAIVLRGVFVALGVALLHTFEWIIFVFGIFLIYTGIKLVRQREVEVHPEDNPVIRFFERHLRVTSGYEGKHFVVRKSGLLYATPLFIVLVAVETTDVVFAVDSIPAIFGVTQDPFIVFSSNIFAILGLRALYFVLHQLMTRFAYLHYGLGIVLSLVGVKMLVSHWVEVPIELSLGVIVVVLGGAVLLSWLKDGAGGEVGRHGPG